MRSLSFKSLVLMVILALGTASIVTRAQEQQPGSTGAPLPSFIIAKDPGESVLKVQTWTDQDSYVPGQLVTVNFQLNQTGYVYLFDIAPEADGKRVVRLIFPSQENSLNFLDKGAASFSSLESSGIGFIQAIATPIPVPFVTSFDETVMGNDPQVAKSDILNKIAARGIREGEWGASWAIYTVRTQHAFGSPSPTEVGDLFVQVVDGQKTACPINDSTPDNAKLLGAWVYSDSPEKSLDAVLNDPASAPNSAFTTVKAQTGLRTVQVVVPLEYKPSRIPRLVQPRDAVDNQGRLNIRKETPVTACFELLPTNQGIAQFTFRPPTPLANQGLTFDASHSSAIGYAWDFGDGSMGEAGSVDKATVSHTYAAGGKYQVTLTAIYSGGQGGYCPTNSAPQYTTSSCTVRRSVDVIPPPGSICPPDCPTSGQQQVTLALAEGSITQLVLQQEQSILGPISQLKVSFSYIYKQFPFTQQMVDNQLLSADSGVHVRLSFVNQAGQEGLYNEAHACILQTDKSSTVPGCTFRLPTGNADSGTITIDFFGDPGLKDPVYWDVINAAIRQGTLQKLRLIVEVGLNIRYNWLFRNGQGGTIEVGYSGFQPMIR